MVKTAWENMIDPVRVFVIAEAGVNHNGDVDLAKKMVDAALDAGCDAIKFQTFSAEDMVTPKAPKAKYQKATSQAGESQFDMLKRLELSREDHEEIFAYCQKRQIMFMSTPFDTQSADFLFDLGLEIFKIPSGEITNLPLLSHIAREKKPIIMSTGMTSMDEIVTAVKTLRAAGNKDLALLHCVSDYPAKPADVNLSFMKILEEKFGVPVGFSDHTLGIEIALAAVALGASVIEKHFTLDTDLEGPDHKISLEPEELKALVKGIRKVKAAIGEGMRRPTPSEMHTAAVVRKSLVAAVDIKEGTLMSEKLIAVKRPGTGLPPVLRSSLIGKRTRVSIPKDKLLSLEMFT